MSEPTAAALSWIEGYADTLLRDEQLNQLTSIGPAHGRNVA
jgi:hypothetical protein